MAKMTLMDILPGILGLAGGALSPKAGEAAGATLEMADQFKQRHRRQALMDEEAARRTVSDERAARQEARSLKSFQWQEADQIYQEGERTRAAEERSRALNAWGETKKELAAEGIEILPEYANWQPDTEEQVGIVGGKHRELASNTPISEELANEMSAQLKAKGEVMYAPVRLSATGTVVRKMLGGYPQSTAAAPPGAAAVTGAIEEYADSVDELGLAENTLEGIESAERNKRFTAIEANSDNFPDARDPGGAAAPRYSTPEQRATVGKAGLGVESAERNLATTGALYPELLAKFLPQLARFLGGSDTQQLPPPTPPAAAQPQPGAKGKERWQKFYKGR